MIEQTQEHVLGNSINRLNNVPSFYVRLATLRPLGPIRRNESKSSPISAPGNHRTSNNVRSMSAIDAKADMLVQDPRITFRTHQSVHLAWAARQSQHRERADQRFSAPLHTLPGSRVRIPSSASSSFKHLVTSAKPSFGSGNSGVTGIEVDAAVAAHGNGCCAPRIPGG
jgi:hypothetical protein